MSVPESKGPEGLKSPVPQENTAAAGEAVVTPAVETFLDLSQADPWSRSVSDPQISIRFGGNVGTGTVRAAREVSGAATDANLAAPQPASLIIHLDPANPRVLHGIPTMKTSPSFLGLTWQEDGSFRANFGAILKLREIVIPPGHRMVINVEKAYHPDHKHCVKLSWSEQCFLAIQERDDSEDQEPEDQEPAK